MNLLELPPLTPAFSSITQQLSRLTVRMSIPPNARQAWSTITKMAAQAQARTGGPGGSGGGGPSPKGVAGGVGGILLLVGGGLFINNALFNVDGGHRAIKYTRVGGVKSEIFNEGRDALIQCLQSSS